MKQAIFDALVELFGGDVERAKEYAALADAINREIKDTELITRDKPDPSEILDAAGVPRWGASDR